PSTTTAIQTLPAVRLERGQLTISQENRPDVIIHGIDAEVQDHGDQVVLEGTGADPYWGNWSLEGTFDRSRACMLTLHTPWVHITQAMLDRLPFVSPKVWRQVQVEGDTPVEFTFRLDPAADKVHYRVALAPKATRVHVASIHLDADQAQGQLAIEDAVVQ